MLNYDSDIAGEKRSHSATEVTDVLLRHYYTAVKKREKTDAEDVCSEPAYFIAYRKQYSLFKITFFSPRCAAELMAHEADEDEGIDLEWTPVIACINYFF